MRTQARNTNCPLWAGDDNQNGQDKNRENKVGQGNQWPGAAPIYSILIYGNHIGQFCLCWPVMFNHDYIRQIRWEVGRTQVGVELHHQARNKLQCIHTKQKMTIGDKQLDNKIN